MTQSVSCADRPEVDHVELIAALSAIVGADHILADPGARTFFSTDIASGGQTAAAVARVSSVEQLSAVLRATTSLGVAVVPRGGGFSYTGGYTPARPGMLTIDMRGLDGIVEINETDMYVRVGTGCTWRVLYETLKAKGYRTPYFGPMSGYRATVGGALSQGSFFLGSTEHGTTADTVLSLEVVLADGTVMHTGSDSGGPTVGPFFRNYGPDLTGLFLADTGALGFKAVATLKLIRFPASQAYGSFSYEDAGAMLDALSEIGRSGLAAEAYAWDPYFVEQMSMASTGTRQDLKFLWNVVRNGAGIVDGVSAGIRVAINGKSVFKLGSHMIQVTIDDHSAAGAAERLRQVRAIASAHGGRELPPSIPRALRATPFVDFNTPERRTTVRNLPTNSLYPHSRAPAALKAIRELLTEEAAVMNQHGIRVGVVHFAVGKQVICIEPLLYWEDEQHLRHDRIAERSDVAALAACRERPPATLYAFSLREKLKVVMSAHGAAHAQIGKAYDYLPSREPRVAELVRAIKISLDPLGLVNPGSLGLGTL